VLFTWSNRGGECSDDAHRRQREGKMVSRPDLFQSQHVGKRAGRKWNATHALLSKPLDDVVEEAKEVRLECVYVVQV
jgi:hypothetical protein